MMNKKKRKKNNSLIAIVKFVISDQPTTDEIFEFSSLLSLLTQSTNDLKSTLCVFFVRQSHIQSFVLALHVIIEF